MTLVTLGTVAHQAPLSTGFPRQGYWSELPFPTPGDLPDPGIKPTSPVLAGGFFITETPRKLPSGDTLMLKHKDPGVTQSYRYPSRDMSTGRGLGGSAHLYKGEEQSH